MSRSTYTFWREGNHIIGFLNASPGHPTPAYSMGGLEQNLTPRIEDIEIPVIA